MKKVYILEFDMFDGEDNIHSIDIFGDLQDAKDYMTECLEQYEPFWEDFDIIDKDDMGFTAYDEDWYDAAHLNITITKKEIM